MPQKSSIPSPLPPSTLCFSPCEVPLAHFAAAVAPEGVDCAPDTPCSPFFVSIAAGSETSSAVVCNAGRWQVAEQWAFAAAESRLCSVPPARAFSIGRFDALLQVTG